MIFVRRTGLVLALLLLACCGLAPLALASGPAPSPPAATGLGALEPGSTGSALALPFTHRGPAASAVDRAAAVARPVAFGGTNTSPAQPYRPVCAPAPTGRARCLADVVTATSAPNAAPLASA